MSASGMGGPLVLALRRSFVEKGRCLRGVHNVLTEGRVRRLTTAAALVAPRGWGASMYGCTPGRMPMRSYRGAQQRPLASVYLDAVSGNSLEDLHVETRRDETEAAEALFYDTTSAQDREQKAQSEKMRAHDADGFHPDVESERRIFEKAVMEDPKSVEYPLHSMEHIPNVVVRSLRSHSIMQVFLSQQDDFNRSRLFSNLENSYENDAMGQVLYFRVIDLRAEERSDCSTQLREEIYHVIQAIVKDYTVATIQPFPLELACDVAHFATHAPFVVASRKYVAQFVKDAERILNGLPFEKDGLAGEAPKSELEPIAPERVAAEIACRIRREALLGPDGEVEAPRAGLGVCIGIARTPVLAKIACDAEVAAAQRHGKDGSKPVRLRSFLQGTQTLEETRAFMSSIPVCHIPLFTPAFSRLLRDAFGVVTCGHIYEKRGDLHFGLSKETFSLCYAAAFGHARFPEEATVIMFSPAYLAYKSDALMEMATNAISLTDSTRTAVLGGIKVLARRRFGAKGYNSIDVHLVYGRLADDEQFFNVVRRAVKHCHGMLRKRCLKAGSLRIDLREGTLMRFSENHNFTPTNNYDEIMDHVLSKAKNVAVHRKQKGSVASGDAYMFGLGLSSLSLSTMIPKRLEDEIEHLQEMYYEARVKVMRLLEPPQSKSSKSRRKPKALPASPASDASGEPQPESSDEGQEPLELSSCPPPTPPPSTPIDAPQSEISTEVTII